MVDNLIDMTIWDLIVLVYRGLSAAIQDWFDATERQDLASNNPLQRDIEKKNHNIRNHIVALSLHCKLQRNISKS